MINDIVPIWSIARFVTITCTIALFSCRYKYKGSSDIFYFSSATKDKDCKLQKFKVMVISGLALVISTVSNIYAASKVFGELCERLQAMIIWFSTA